jgi:hypothetical protein
MACVLTWGCQAQQRNQRDAMQKHFGFTGFLNGYSPSLALKKHHLRLIIISAFSSLLMDAIRPIFSLFHHQNQSSIKGRFVTEINLS